MNRFLKLILFSFVITLGFVSSNGASVGPGTRIVGGTVADDGAFPYQASLRSWDRHFCGGSIIALKHILTAAHCVPNPNLATLTVITGTDSLARGGETHRVVNVTSHPEYIGRPNLWRYDIAVLTLENELRVTPLQRPIALSIVDPPYGVRGIVSGWGRIFAQSVLQPARLQTMEHTIFSNELCRRVVNSTDIVDAHLCAINGWGHGVCSGDSGGPLVYNDVLIGVVSWGYTPCAGGFPDVYARVSAVIGFIEEATGLSFS